MKIIGASGSTLYFLSAKDNVLYLSRMDLSSPSLDADFPFPFETSSIPFSDEFSVANGKIYSGSQSEVDLSSWAQLSDSAGNNLSRRIFYISESFLVSAEMDDYGGQNVRALYLIDIHSGLEGVFPHVY